MSGNFGQQQFQRQQFKHKPSDIKKGVDHEAVKKQLAIPAKGLLITGGLSLFIVIFGTIGGFIYGSVQLEQLQQDLVVRMYGAEEVSDSSQRRRVNKTVAKKQKEKKEKRTKQANTVITLVIGGVVITALILCSFYIYAVAAGILLGKLENYKLCKLACIIALIPIASPLLVAGIPFGIMGLAKLRDPTVKKAFNQGN